MQSNPTISVVIPAFNREAFVAESIESVLGQTLPVDEIVVVDDGSVDRTFEIAETYSRRGVTCIAKSHSGAAATRNAAILACHGDYILVMDSDDVMFEDGVERLVRGFERDPGRDVYYGDLVATDEQLSPIRWIRYPQWRGREDRLFSAHAFTNQIGNPFCLIRHDWLLSRNGYAETIVRCEDWELWCRSSGEMHVSHVEAKLGFWRWHTQNMSANRRQHSQVSDDRAIRTRIRQTLTAEEHVARLGWEPVIEASGARHILIWGAGEYGEAADEMLRYVGVEPSGFVDSDPSKAGSRYRGLDVYSPNRLREGVSRPFVVVASVYEHEIAATLAAMGFQEDKDYARPHGVEYRRL